eukprot:scaffold6127_cov159-Isochrysis_galbana.AAC.2
MLCLEEFSGGLFGPSGFLFASGGFLREAERLSLGPPDLELPAQLQWVNVLKLEVREGAATPEGVFAALTSHA